MHSLLLIPAAQGAVTVTRSVAEPNAVIGPLPTGPARGAAWASVTSEEIDSCSHY
jgi:hypothetical protein